MTLTTTLYVGDPVDYREMWRRLRQLLGATDADPTHEGPCSAFHPGCLELLHPQDLGLPALVWMLVGQDGPIPPDHLDQEQAHRHFAGCPWPVTAALSLDTTYSTRFRGGATAADLHAALLDDLIGWLEHRGVRHYRWRQEELGLDATSREELGRLGDMRLGRMAFGERELVREGAAS